MTYAIVNFADLAYDTSSLELFASQVIPSSRNEGPVLTDRTLLRSGGGVNSRKPPWPSAASRR